MSANLSSNISGEIINNHFNECYVAHKDIEIPDLKLQLEEVSEAKWWSKEEFLKTFSDNPELFAEKTGPWENVKRYYAFLDSKN